MNQLKQAELLLELQDEQQQVVGQVEPQQEVHLTLLMLHSMWVEE